MKLGPCLDTNTFVADIVDEGGATGVWDGTSGTFTVNIEASYNDTCPGTSGTTQVSTLTLTINASGAIIITILGEGETFNEDFDVATAVLNGELIARSNSAGGGLTTCEPAPLVLRTNTTPVSFCQCPNAELVLKWDTVDQFWNGNWTCTFTVTVVA